MVERGDEVGIQVIVADNVRPTLDAEYLDSAQAQLAALYHRQKSMNTPGFAVAGSWTEHGVYPTTHSFGRMIHLLGGLKRQNVIGVDIGSASTTIAAYIDGERYLNVFGHLGVGHSANDALSHIRPGALLRWLTYEPDSADDAIDYIWNKSVFPQTVPANRDDLEVEYALAREILRTATFSARQSWRGERQRGLLPPFPTIVLSGSTLTKPPHYGWSVLVALDALQPVGISQFLLDPYGVAAALGAIAPHNPLTVVQALETGTFYNLATVVSISGRARRGEVVLRGSVKPEGADRAEPFEARFGTITRVPLAHGIRAEVTLQPRYVEVDGVRRKRKLSITGGALGLIIDARGRPWRFPRTSEQRRERMTRWLMAITQEE
jgi:hypothetical protein